MRAILLAAGRGRRLGIDEPKSLLRFSGRSLLERHLDHLVACGIDQLTVVVGHKKELLQAELDRVRRQREQAGAPLGLDVETLFNELYERSSIVSLQRAGDRLRDGAVWMDADVLYPRELLRRLVESPSPNAALIDASASEGGEEMMLAANGGRVVKVGRKVGEGFEVVGESVGFYKVDPSGGAAMKKALDAEVAAGRMDQEHEDAMRIALEEVPFGFERIDDLPWTEIDFAEDVAKAEKLAVQIDQD
ncbi:MAG: phosphocholine cytidylyltransferase family protein [Deltaproteobacteria bacterium]|jgi:choline kinase|nr:phosphocholine cytidylyltransferase family protein [Deltaproteobacteria bacterium]MBW2535204.1 phosphocholine cytidylyltransferase family protein [Deltaproteobacteria bacterium]